MKHHRIIAVLAIATSGTLAACGSDDSAADPTDAPAEAPTTTAIPAPASTAPATSPRETHPDPAPTDAPTTTPTAPTAPSTAAATTPPTAPPTTLADDGVVTIALSDFAFGGLPESVPAGTRLAIENISEAELHEIVAFKVPDGEARSAEELLALPEEELLAIVGPIPTTVLLAPPGAPQIDALGDGTLTEPGRYLLLCAIPTGIDPAEYLAAAAAAGGGPPQVENGGPPHFVHGMHAELIVV